MIGNKIKNRRIQLGLSQQDLAKKLGYKDRSTIAKIESGVNDVTQSVIKALAQALDVSVLWLLADDEEPAPSPVLNEEEQELFDMIKNLSSENKQALLTLAKGLK